MVKRLSSRAMQPSRFQESIGCMRSLGMVASVKVVDASVYWDLIATEKNDPQIAYNNWSQDFPEGEDFIDTQLNGEGIVNVGNIQLTKPKISGDRVLLEAACTTTTFRFLDEAERQKINQDKKKNDKTGKSA